LVIRLPPFLASSRKAGLDGKEALGADAAKYLP